MKNLEVVRYKQRLDDLFKRINSLAGDIEMQAQWAQHLCIITSGFIESSVRILFIEYAKVKAAPYIVNFVSHELQSFQNAKSEKILELTRTFNPQWEFELRAFMEGKRKDAIDSIVSTRHQIAHGRPVGITYTRILDYYKSSVEVIDFIQYLLLR